MIPKTLIALSLLAASSSSAQTLPATIPTTQPGVVNVVEVYQRAAERIQGDSPASSNLEYPNYPPYSEQWEELAKAAWEQNAEARELVRSVRNVDTVTWPNTGDFKYLNGSRELANQIGDAALYLDTQGDSGAAFDALNDLWHMTDLLRPHEQKGTLVELLVSVGIDALALNRLMIITSGVTLSRDADNPKALSVDGANTLVARLLVPVDAKAMKAQFADEFKHVRGGEGTVQGNMDEIMEMIRRINVERSCAAMSLACHVFKFDTGRWPKAADELAPKYLLSIPLDPAGDGKQPLGYVLISDGLPDQSDRPLVFSRLQSHDGLFYRDDSPQYGFYSSGVRPKPKGDYFQYGQFRDIARWSPLADPKSPTTRPLP